MTPAECTKILALLAAAYPRFEISDATIEVYTECLADLTFDRVRTAALRIIQSSKFFPTVVELRDGSYSNAPNPEAVRRNAEREAKDIAEQNAHARAELARLGIEIDPSDPKIRQGLLSRIGGGG